MMIKQARNPILIIPAVLVGSFFFTMFHLWLSGEFKGWADIADVANHASFTATMMTVGWIFLRSPWAGKITEMIGTQSVPGPGGPTVSTAKVTISEPPTEAKP